MSATRLKADASGTYANANLRAPRISSRLWWLGCGAAPAAWSAHWLGGYALASRLCDIGAAPRHLALDWRFVLLTFAMAALALAGAFAAWQCWQLARLQKPAAQRRTQFIAVCALLCSGLFVVALVFSSAGLVVAPLCG